ncbi:MAG: hypothetical protein ACR2JR_09135 [Rubrobacteraceae bacterium]
MEQKETGGAARVGMRWGGIGGVVAFLVSLLGSVAGMVAAIFVGISCGRRAAVADAAADEGNVERRPGALSGLVGGAVAAPVFVFGAAAGALVAARGFGTARMAETLSQMLGTRISPDQAWQLFLLSLVFSAVAQAAILVISSTAAGAWAARNG